MITKIRLYRPEVYQFTQIPNCLCRDQQLSDRGLAALVFLFSHTDSWVSTADTVMERFNWGSKQFSRVFRHLRELGYAKLVSLKQDNKWVGREYVITLNPEAGGSERMETALLGVSRKGRLKDRISSKVVPTLQERQNTTTGAVPPTSEEKLVNLIIKKLQVHTSTTYRTNGTPPNLAGWRKEIGKLLRKTLEGDTARLQRVAKAYFTVEHDEHTPEVHNGFMFCKKFTQIERWANGSDPLPPKEEYVVEVASRRVF